MQKNIMILTSLIFLISAACAKDESNKCTTAPAIFLGNDTTLVSTNTLKLNAVTKADSGRWTVLSGNSGTFQDSSLANTQFTGSLNEIYKLQWDSYNSCGKNSDTMSVTFKSESTPAQMVEKMHWLGQADYRIEAAGKVIYIDHVKGANDLPADLVLITHSHGDHFSNAAIAKVANANTVVVGPADCAYTGVCKEFITIVPGGEYALNEFVKIKAVPAYNVVKTSNHNKSRKWVGYLITAEGVTIYHAGDTERIPEMKDFTCDIALMPLGQTYTMVSVDDAVEATKDVQAHIGIPMHYGLYEGTAADALSYKEKLSGIIDVIIKTKE